MAGRARCAYCSSPRSGSAASSRRAASTSSTTRKSSGRPACGAKRRSASRAKPWKVLTVTPAASGAARRSRSRSSSAARWEKVRTRISGPVTPAVRSRCSTRDERARLARARAGVDEDTRGHGLGRAALARIERRIPWMAIVGRLVAHTAQDGADESIEGARRGDSIGLGEGTVAVPGQKPCAQTGGGGEQLPGEHVGLDLARLARVIAPDAPLAQGEDNGESCLVDVGGTARVAAGVAGTGSPLMGDGKSPLGGPGRLI